MSDSPSGFTLQEMQALDEPKLVLSVSIFVWLGRSGFAMVFVPPKGRSWKRRKETTDLDWETSGARCLTCWNPLIRKEVDLETTRLLPLFQLFCTQWVRSFSTMAGGLGSLPPLLLLQRFRTPSKQLLATTACFWIKGGLLAISWDVPQPIVIFRAAAFLCYVFRLHPGWIEFGSLCFEV